MSQTGTQRKSLKVVVTADVPIRNPEILCPGGILRWGNCDFLFNPPPETACDFWIVTAGAPVETRIVCAPENTLFASGEPPAKKPYPRKFLAQFQHVVSASATEPHPRVIQSQLPLNWLVGFDSAQGMFRYGYDELTRQTKPEKALRLSVVCSSLRSTEGQRQRLDFLAQLKKRLGDQLVHFGRGFTPIEDKMDAIAPYHYHLVLENSVSDYYWTEKLADAYLGWAFPLYLGCPNLDKFFPPEAFARVDPQQFEQTVERIERIITAPPMPAVEAALRTSRNLVLNQYHLFALLAKWAEQLYRPDGQARRLTIRSHKAFRTFPQGLLFRLRHTTQRPKPQLIH